MLRIMAVATVAGICALGAAAPAARAAAATEQTFYIRTTQDLVDLCSADSKTAMDTAAINFCQGYMVGFYEALRSVDEARGAAAFCPPNPPLTRNQAVAMFVKWGGEHADALTLPPAEGMFAFLTDSFPCSGTKP